MLIVGLTGNFGMGKSTVARMFRELGAATIDTDDIVRELFSDPVVLFEIKKAFGEEIAAGGVLDKGALATLVFEHPPLRISLENILHPRVFARIGEEVGSLAAGGARMVIVEAPVLFERGYQNRFDRIVTVFTSEETAVQRLTGKGISVEEARKRLQSQFPIDMKREKSDYTIDNSRTPDDTRRQVEYVYRELSGQGGGTTRRGGVPGRDNGDH
ncbi:MAG: dephospho-CoA kinase [Nitrospirales bacterium]|nr:dephospho-CoA kinase [Nitrospirales bacterium]